MSGGLLSASGTDTEQDVDHGTLLTESSPEADGHGQDPTSLQDSAYEHSTSGPQNMSLEERKKHRAEVARMAKATKAGERARPLSALFADPAHAVAVHGMLHSGMLASREVRAKKWKVKPKWLGSMTDVLAKILLDVEWSCWGDLLSTIETAKEQGLVKPLSFAFVRMYDETPQLMGTYGLSEKGEKEGGITTAKVMAANLGFSMTLQMRAAPSRQEGSARAGANTLPLPLSEFQIIHGGLGSTLADLQDMTGPATLHCIQRHMWMSPAEQRRVELLFPRCVILRMTDMHGSNLAAERHEATLRSKWASALFRCCMHRIQTAEKVLLQGLERKTESF